LDDAAFLCLTVTTPRRLPRLPLPFLLHRER
jgi:hypothetical protein